MNKNVKRIKVYDLDMNILGKTSIISSFPLDSMDSFVLAARQVDSWCILNNLEYDNVFWDYA